jgi:hypothetical protein
MTANMNVVHNLLNNSREVEHRMAA